MLFQNEGERSDHVRLVPCIFDTECLKRTISDRSWEVLGVEEEGGQEM